MNWFIASVAVLLALPATAYEYVQMVEGTAQAVDGDDIRIGGQQIRLQGIAAPEWDTGAGQAAYASLRSLADGQIATCYLDGTTTYDRVVGRCAVEGIDLGLSQVVGGFALDCARFSRGDYGAAERQAVQSGRDLASVYRRPAYCTPR